MDVMTNNLVRSKARVKGEGKEKDSSEVVTSTDSNTELGGCAEEWKVRQDKGWAWTETPMYKYISVGFQFGLPRHHTEDKRS